ncbi:unnamed protein product [Phaedon cochleariae]|uniref:DH domain-containing protein n=1 Tax=Phaedon cochleariae TaxID=80249 RepID=A0A9N9SP01_PHACE|nr:unnamed protein product [Phaedon cochleariae]
MWSKQADTRNTNKNMTSFKNKITNRKRKNSKSRTDDSVETDTTSKSKQNEEKDKQRQPKCGKNRGRNRGKKDAETVNKKPVQEPKNSAESKPPNDAIENADVVLRHPNKDKPNPSNNCVKRYSDSFVIDKNDKTDKNLGEDSDQVAPVLTRAVSGFFIIDQARKARRFSDLFKPSGTLKLSNSTECLRMNNERNVSQQKVNDKGKLTHKPSLNAKGDANAKRSAKVESPKAQPKKEPPTGSYLKRVRSKIYKTKADSVAKDEVDATSKSRKLKPKKSSEASGRIPEDEVAVLTPNGVRKSLTHFDFRLTRQTSNLERVRPKTSDSSCNHLGSSDKPVLAKAKSSSAINLSLLRTRRNQIMEKVASRMGAKDVQSEFDFIAFGSVNNLTQDRLYGSQTSLQSMQKQPSWLHIHREEKEVDEKVDVKQGQPVSRSGSDRRPDAVREEAAKHHPHHHHQEASGGGTEAPHDASVEKTEANAMVSSTILPAAGSQRKVNSNINRSESVKEQSEKRKQRRNISDPSHNTTSGDVDLDRHTGLSNTDSGSSSNSSISCNGRLSESPSNSVEAVIQAAAQRGAPDSDSDIDVESEQWQNLVPLEELKNLSPHEKKRQDVINELFHTESSHVRNLKVLYKIFYKKIHETQTLKQDELNLLFPNIKEILDLHTEFSKEMRRRRREDPIVKELGAMLGGMFGDRFGESLKRAAATFCERQQLALEFIKRRRERDSKFDAVLIECEKKRQCRRLQLQGILPTEMQRLSKYPLLLERLIHSVESDPEQAQQQEEELSRLKRAHHMSKEILNHVNEAAKLAHNQHRLEDIQRHLDTSNFERSDYPIAQEFRPLDLSKYRLILEGSMHLRRPNKPIVPVHILLLEEIVVILHREGEKFHLKFFQSGSTTNTMPLAPIIKMSTLLVRTNASYKNALFLVNMATNNIHMYDLIAEDEIKREVWFKHFTDATESYNKRQGKPPAAASDKPAPGAAPTSSSDSDGEEVVHDLPPAQEVAEQRAAEVEGEGPPRDPPPEEAGTGDEEAEQEERRTVEDDGEESEMVAGGGVETTRVSAEDWPLIQPSQVSIAVPPVHTAESMLTPLEQIRRKDATVTRALEDKEVLVADLLSIPREHFRHIADMASMDESASRDPSERVLASIYLVDRLQKAVNEATNVGDLDVMAAKGGRHAVCTGQQDQPSEHVEPPLTVPASLVRDIAGSLSLQLTTLLSEAKRVEEERDRLRKELHKMREALHVEHNLHSPVPADDLNLTSSTDVSDQNATLSDSIQIVTKSDCEEDH